jgi:hypothetical protein
MLMKRLLICATLCGAMSVVLIVPASAPAYRTGTYRGTTTQGLPMQLTVKAVFIRVGGRLVRRGAVDSFRVSITDTCPDGFRDPHPNYGSRSDRLISLTGTFAYTIGSSTQPLRFSGRLTGSRSASRASGRTSDVTANSSHGGLCRSGLLFWSAR